MLIHTPISIYLHIHILYRGETQSLATATLGSKSMEAKFETLGTFMSGMHMFEGLYTFLMYTHIL